MADLSRRGFLTTMSVTTGVGIAGSLGLHKLLIGDGSQAAPAAAAGTAPAAAPQPMSSAAQLPSLDAVRLGGPTIMPISATWRPRPGVVPGFPGNFTGKPQADLLRVNLAIPPAASPNRLGLLGGDHRWFPEWPPRGRRHGQHRAPGGGRRGPQPGGQDVHPRCGGRRGHQGVTPDVNDRYQKSFPYLGTPKDGFHTPAN